MYVNRFTARQGKDRFVKGGGRGKRIVKEKGGTDSQTGYTFSESFESKSSVHFLPLLPNTLLRFRFQANLISCVTSILSKLQGSIRY